MTHVLLDQVMNYEGRFDGVTRRETKKGGSREEGITEIIEQQQSKATTRYDYHLVGLGAG